MNYSKSPRIFWAGWETDAWKLQQYGWEISFEENAWRDRDTMRIAIKHPTMQLYGLSQEFSKLSHYELARYPRYGEDGLQFPDMIQISYMSSRLIVQVQTHLDPKDWKACAELPRLTEYQELEKCHLDDFNIFRPLRAQNEFVVEEASVPELLDIILSKQDPVQKEIREKRRKELRKLGRQAQILRLEGCSLPMEELEQKSEVAVQLIAV